MKCAYHPDKDASALCVSCGVGLCVDCRKRERGMTFCEDCLRTHEPPRVYPRGAGNGLNAWSVVAWVLAVIGWWPSLTFISIGGVLLGFVALADIRLHSPEQGGRAYAYAAIICGGGSLAVKLSIVAYMLWYGLEHSPFDAFRYLGL